MTLCRVSIDELNHDLRSSAPRLCDMCDTEPLSAEAIELGLTCCWKCIRPSCKGVDGKGCVYKGYAHAMSEQDMCARCEYNYLCTLNVGDFVREEDMEAECELWAERAGIVHQKKQTVFSMQPRMVPVSHPQPITELQFAGLWTLFIAACLLVFLKF